MYCGKHNPARFVILNLFQDLYVGPDMDAETPANVIPVGGEADKPGSPALIR